MESFLLRFETASHHEYVRFFNNESLPSLLCSLSKIFEINSPEVVNKKELEKFLSKCMRIYNKNNMNKDYPANNSFAYLILHFAAKQKIIDCIKIELLLEINTKVRISSIDENFLETIKNNQKSTSL